MPSGRLCRKLMPSYRQGGWDGEAKEDERSLLIEFDAGQADNEPIFLRCHPRR
ncbi:MAG: hypothetical protein CM1200mP34_3560 [Verrucomicrobiales bacterium]|nr:MAG: hypothetical protein CM1200mP34_3560 [Verrucomicrobiales bacterium]